MGTVKLLTILIVKAYCPTHSLLSVWDSAVGKVLDCHRDALVMQCTGGNCQQSCICTRAVVASEPDVLITHLAIERAGNYNLFGCPVVNDSLVLLQAPSHGHVECISCSLALFLA